MVKPMGASNKNKATPSKGSPKRTGKKINERPLSNQQKVDFINEKPSTTVVKSKLKPGAPVPVVYGVSPSVGSLNEGSSVTFTFTTTGTDGTFYWTNSGTATGADFTDGANSGSFVTSGGSAAIVRNVKNDLLTEGSETIIFEARNGSFSGSILASSSVVTINDTSLTQYGLAASTGSVNEGSSVTFTFTTSGPDNTFYWTNGGTTSAADFSDATNSGSFATTSGTGSITRTLVNDVTTEGAETILMQVRDSGFAGTILASASVDVNDTSTAPVGISPNWTVGASGASFTTLSAALASPSVLDGHYIRVLSGTYTLSSLLNVNKQVYIGGTPGNKGEVVIQSAGTSSDPVTLVQVSAPNVLFKDLTFKHRKTTNTSIETCIALTSASAGNNVRVSNFIMDSCRVEHVEFGLVVRGNDFKVANNEIAYVGPNNSTRRHIGLYGSSGSCFFSNNAFEDSTAGAVTGNTNIFYLTSTTGLVPQEKYTGTLVIEGSTWVSSTGKQPNQFFNIDNCQSDSTINLMFKNNVMNEKNVFAVLYGSTTNFGNVFGDITFQNNTLSNLHGGTPAGGKGMLAIDGGGSNITWRSSNLVAHIDGNTINNTTYRTDYSAVDGPRIGRATAPIASFSANVDTSIPSTPSAPTTPTLAAS